MCNIFHIRCSVSDLLKASDYDTYRAKFFILSNVFVFTFCFSSKRTLFFIQFLKRRRTLMQRRHWATTTHCYFYKMSTSPSLNTHTHTRTFLLSCLRCALQHPVAEDRETTMSAKVNMEAPPKEPDPLPADQPAPPPSEAVLVTGSDSSVAKKAPRPQAHTTTAFLLQGERKSNAPPSPLAFLFF